LRGVSKDRRKRPWPILRGSPLRGEHLRITGVYVAAPYFLYFLSAAAMSLPR
jgi:hypothetical protein